MSKSDGKSGEVKKRLVDQLRIVFIAGLLSLWTTTLELVPAERGPWIPWLIASALLFGWFVYIRNNFRRSKLRWVFPFVAVALLWLMYFLSGVSFPTYIFTIFAIVLLAWALIILLALLLVMTFNLTKRRLGQYIQYFAEWGENVYWPIAVFVLLMSILIAWIRLWTSGMRGWWMEPLLIFGVIIFIVSSLASLSSRRESDLPP